MKAFGAVIQRFKKVKPDLEGPISPEESVRMQLAVIDSLTIKDSGAFLSHHGDTNWL